MERMLRGLRQVSSGVISSESAARPKERQDSVFVVGTGEFPGIARERVLAARILSATKSSSEYSFFCSLSTGVNARRSATYG